MRRLPWAALGLLAAIAGMNVVFVGCGSDDVSVEDPPDGSGGNETGTKPDTGAADASTDRFISTIDGSRADADVCKLQAQSCAKSSECCSANCNTTTLLCDSPLSACSLPNVGCAAGPECCTNSCIGGKCSDKQCVADNLACANNAECCGGTCAPDGLGGGKCTPLNGGGPATNGNPCTLNTQCASQFCNNGVCTGSSFCRQLGEACSAPSDCCGGLCTKAAGAALGVCGSVKSGGCGTAGTVCDSVNGACTSASACCSRSCAPYPPTGKTVCQPSSGCHVEDELCRVNSDCCGWSGSPQPINGPYECVKSSPTQEFGFCGKQNACREPGSVCGKALEADGVTIGVCSANNNCCELPGAGSSDCNSHPERCCRRDALGVPRCVISGKLDCNAAPPAPGAVCATSADCCGKPCVDNKCSGVCIPADGVCTANADCCAGLPCTIPQGALKGICGGKALADGGVAPNPDAGTIKNDAGVTCGLYGQACNANGDCCSGVPCNNGTCRFN